MFYLYLPKASSHPVRGSGSFADDCLKAHNTARGWHTDTPDMTWSDDLERQMQNYLDGKISMDEIPPSCTKPRCYYGENQFISDDSKEPPCANAVFDWYQESYTPKAYDYSQGFYWQDEVTHFTQVIWKDSTQVGCAKAQSTSSKKWHIFCMYQSYGNVPTKPSSLANVNEPKSDFVQPSGPSDFM